MKQFYLDILSKLKMVELSDPKGPFKEGIDNTIFVIPGIIVLLLVGECNTVVFF